MRSPRRPTLPPRESISVQSLPIYFARDIYLFPFGRSEKQVKHPQAHLNMQITSFSPYTDNWMFIIERRIELGKNILRSFWFFFWRESSYTLQLEWSNATLRVMGPRERSPLSFSVSFSQQKCEVRKKNPHARNSRPVIKNPFRVEQDENGGRKKKFSTPPLKKDDDKRCGKHFQLW